MNDSKHHDISKHHENQELHRRARQCHLLPRYLPSPPPNPIITCSLCPLITPITAPTTRTSPKHPTAKPPCLSTHFWLLPTLHASSKLHRCKTNRDQYLGIEGLPFAPYPMRHSHDNTRSVQPPIPPSTQWACYIVGLFLGRIGKDGIKDGNTDGVYRIMDAIV